VTDLIPAMCADHFLIVTVKICQNQSTETNQS